MTNTPEPPIPLSLIEELETIPPVQWTGKDGAEWLPREYVLSVVRNHTSVNPTPDSLIAGMEAQTFTGDAAIPERVKGWNLAIKRCVAIVRQHYEGAGSSELRPSQGGDTAQMPSSSPSSSEIPVNAHFDDAVEHLAWLKKTASDTADNARIVGFEDCLRAWKDSLRASKPVTVSLTTCERTLAEHVRPMYLAGYSYRDVAKAVLDTAGVAYVD